MRRNVLKWFKSYINVRKQRTYINGIMSDILDIVCGMPQSSVLGLLFFILYIHDLKKYIGEHCKIRMFANDTMIYIIEKGRNSMERKLNFIMTLLDSWINKNSMFLNPNKTFYMICKNDRMHQDKQLDIFYRGSKINRVHDIKY